MRVTFKSFLASESGAVTVDWVVLTGAIVGLGFSVIALVSGGALDQSSGLGVHLSDREISDYLKN
ncbi:MAG: hypothetical protein OIF48_11625 [Silicimonas sp.]|nr:hypothetical protein [Silicimonas sp.]